MKDPINGAVMNGYEVHIGRHEHEEGKPMVVEITFKSSSCNYVQVLSIETAHELAASLKLALGNY